MAHYNHTAIEKKWREHWEKNPVNVNDGKKEKYYCLDMFPYPSGSGLHVGHWRGYVISDLSLIHIWLWTTASTTLSSLRK